MPSAPPVEHDATSSVRSDAMRAYTLSTGMQRSGQLPEAERAALEAVRLQPEDVRFRLQLSEVLLQQRKLGPGWRALLDVLALAPENERALLRIDQVWQGAIAGGLLNVGVPAAMLREQLGAPQRTVERGDSGHTWHYAHYAVDIDQGAVQAARDTRAPTPAYALNFAPPNPWRVVQRTVNPLQRSEQYLLPNESLRTWRQMLSVQVLFEANHALSSAQVLADARRDDIKRRMPQAVFQTLETPADSQDVFYRVSVPPTPGRPGLQQIVRIFADDEGNLYQLSYALRAASELPEGAEQFWVERMAAAHVTAL